MTEDRDPIRSKVISFFKKQPSYSGNEELADKTDLFENGLLDSISAIRLIVFIESEFKIVVNPSDLIGSQFNCIENICQYIKGKMG